MKAIPIIQIQEQPTERIRFCPAHHPKTKRSHVTTTQQSYWHAQAMKVLKETGVHHLYQQFLCFHQQFQDSIMDQDLERVRKISEIFYHSYVNQQSEERESIRDLLEEVYALRQKLYEYEAPDNLQSISSSFTLPIHDLNASGSTEKHNEQMMHSLLSAQKQKQGRKRRARMDEEDSKWEMQRMIVELASLYWQAVAWVLPEQADQLRDALSLSMKNSTEESYLLDQFQHLIQIIRFCQSQLNSEFSE